MAQHKSYLIVSIFALLLAGTIILAACTPNIINSPPYPPNNPPTDTGTTGGTGGTNLAGSLPTQEMKKFSSISDLQTFLQQSQGTGGSPSYNRGGMMAEGVAAPSAADSGTTGGGGAVDYSQTNVQVAGVDEADFVKNDASYIYIIANNQLVIVDTRDPKNAEILSKTNIPDENTDTNSNNYYGKPQAQQLFIDGDSLALIVQGWEQAYSFQPYDIQPYPTSRTKTIVYIYDVSDRTKPKLSQTIQTSGSFYQARMIKGMVYLATQEYVNDYVHIYPPFVKEGSARTIAPDIYYFDNPDQNYQFNTITSIDINKEKVIDSKTLLLGYSNTFMMSESNIYIAYQKQQYWWWGWMRPYNQQYDTERFYTVVVPLLEGDLKAKVRDIIDQKLSQKQEWQQISTVLEGFYAKVNADSQLKSRNEDMLTKISDALEEYDTKKALENSKTVIQKLSVDNGKIDYVGKGEAYGRLLNQFSLDEYSGNLRIATTVDVWVKKRITENNVYVFDKDMKKIGELTGLAPDETIYSTRFLGDRLYMVTFKRIDPLFVISLADPENPEVLGKLKIPGFSDYLHPYDENHIIGIGKDTESNDWGGISTSGVKIALFDVSDVAHPKEVDSVVIGDAGSDSPALHDHKAFLFSKTKGIIVLPVTEVTKREQKSQYVWSNSIWNGAYVYHVDTSGFSEIGKVEHSHKQSDYFDWWDQASVLRSLYMDNALYTISTKYIKVNDLAHGLADLGTISLPYAENYRYPIYSR